MWKIVMLSAMIVAASTMRVACAADGDTRALVPMPAPMQQHLLANMRDHLLAIAEIQEALGAGAFERAGEIAERRLGMTSLASHGASHMAPFMPKPMQEIGTNLHRIASRFAAVAQESAADGDLKRVVEGLAQVTRQCVACHAAYRAH